MPKATSHTQHTRAIEQRMGMTFTKLNKLIRELDLMTSAEHMAHIEAIRERISAARAEFAAYRAENGLDSHLKPLDKTALRKAAKPKHTNKELHHGKS